MNVEAAGLDLVAELRVGWYNDVAPEGWRLPDFGDPASRAIVVGATRALWPAFRAGGRGSLEEHVRAAVEEATAGLPCEVRYAWERAPRGVAIQRMAEAAGLAFVSPARLAVHPRHGPWISLHAAIVVDEPGPDARPSRPPGLCDGCEERCVPLLRAAVARSGALLHADPDRALAESWREWLAVRDACPVGREWRYGDEQIRYGYTKLLP
jgi:methylmalonic aciduria homocystinuria type C protein